MNLKSIGKGHANRTLYGPRVEKVKHYPDGQTSRSWDHPQIGIERGEVEIFVDIEALASLLGHRALKSKSGKSLLHGGIVTVRVISRKKELNNE